MKKILAMLMAVVLMLTMFAGCSEEEVPAENSAEYALKIGETEFTKNDIDFMYIFTFNNMYNSLYSYYGEYVASVLDISKPLEEQLIDGETSWHQYIMQYMEGDLISLTAIYELAVKEGFVLPEEYQADLDTVAEQIAEVAEESGITTEEYIALMYGDKMDIETIVKMTEFRYVAAAYAEQFESQITVTDEDIAAYYEANKDSLETVDFRYYSFFYGEEEGNLTPEEAEEKANLIAATKTSEEFNALAYEFSSEEQKAYFADGNDATLFPGASYDSTGIEEISEWLFDEARQKGDTFVYHDESYKSYLTVMFEERISADYDYIDIRHILITPETDAEGNKDWAAAEAKANDVLAEYLAGDMTEDSFSALAAAYSADGNASKGGIYEDVYKGQMVEPFENWCFDPARQIGDTGIVKTTYGYHVMYFVGFGANNLVSLIEPTIQQQMLNDWISENALGIVTDKTEVYETVGGMIDDIVAAANALAEEQAASIETSSK